MLQTSTRKEKTSQEIPKSTSKISMILADIEWTRVL
jgi:hypothetical protein